MIAWSVTLRVIISYKVALFFVRVETLKGMSEIYCNMFQCYHSNISAGVHKKHWKRRWSSHKFFRVLWQTADFEHYILYINRAAVTRSVLSGSHHVVSHAYWKWKFVNKAITRLSRNVHLCQFVFMYEYISIIIGPCDLAYKKKKNWVTAFRFKLKSTYFKMDLTYFNLKLLVLIF